MKNDLNKLIEVVLNDDTKLSHSKMGKVDYIGELTKYGCELTKKAVE